MSAQLWLYIALGLLVAAAIAFQVWILRGELYRSTEDGAATKLARTLRILNMVLLAAAIIIVAIFLFLRR